MEQSIMEDEDLTLSYGVHVRSWYREMDFELDLLRSYVKSVECLIAESIDIYHREKETHIIREDPDEGWADIITVHQGVDDQTYNLDSIFEDYFPDLQRRSALITLFSFFERQLDGLCRRYKEEKKFALSFTELTGNGIDRSTLYLAKVAGLSLNKGTVTWQEIKNIQSVRNAIVHNDGRLKDKDTIEYCRKRDILSRETEVTIKAEYLPHVIKTFDSYFKGINELITRIDPS